MSLNKINLNKPFLPPLKEFDSYLKQIWNNRILTNTGIYHKKLEKELCKYLGVKYISLTNNGTSALILALRISDLKGEVITTPYSVPATTHPLIWNNLKPVFVDVEKETLNINPKEIEKKISKKTSAILAVHIYGNPCNVTELSKIAKKHKLKIIYDACHAFGVKIKNKSIFNFGDFSVVSFHATKTFHTFEGGAIICHDKKTKEKIDKLINFGIEGKNNKIEVKNLGLNAKMNETEAIMGLLQLKYFKKITKKREEVFNKYKNELKKINGISTLNLKKNVKNNYSYFPIFIDKKFGISRDNLYNKLLENGIVVKKYFYPTINEFKFYKKTKDKTPIAKEMSKKVLCLPLYPELKDKEIKTIVNLLKKYKK